MSEVWKPVGGFEGRYEVSSLGRIKRLACVVYRMHRGKIVTQFFGERLLVGVKLSQRGYPRVNLLNRVQFVHQIVAAAFLPDSPDKPQINHIDGVKTNNCAVNLERVTNQQNRDHAVANGLQARRETGHGKLSEEDVLGARKFAEGGVLQKDIGRWFGVCQQTISQILRE